MGAGRLHQLHRQHARASSMVATSEGSSSQLASRLPCGATSWAEGLGLRAGAAGRAMHAISNARGAEARDYRLTPRGSGQGPTPHEVDDGHSYLLCCCGPVQARLRQPVPVTLRGAACACAPARDWLTEPSEPCVLGGMVALGGVRAEGEICRTSPCLTQTAWARANATDGSECCRCSWPAQRLGAGAVAR